MSLDTDTSKKPHDRLAQFLSDDLSAVDSLIRERMASENAPRIPEVTAHLVDAGGKRVRPMLTLAAARLCGYEGDNHVRLAATVEFIHTATLLHDDVVDESRQRRGKPTAHLLVCGKAIATELGMGARPCPIDFPSCRDFHYLELDQEARVEAAREAVMDKMLQVTRS